MFRRLFFSFCLPALAAALAGCSGTGGALGLAPQVAAPSATRVLRSSLTLNGILTSVLGVVTRPLCTLIADPRRASCSSSVRVMSTSLSSGGPAGGLEPSDLATLYAYPAPSAQSSTTQTVGVVVAYGNASALSDLAVYRSQFGLPPCTASNGCFTQVGTTSTQPLATASEARTPASVSANPTTNYSGWTAETDTDLEAVSAVCPHCRIVLSVAPSDQLSDLGNAVTAAIGAGATIVSASFGATEDPSQTAYESLFEPGNGVRVVAAAGDSGPGLMFPADATNVVAVAGTTITVSGNSVGESLWSGSGGGCSAVFAKPAWQSSCGFRNVADVAAVGDPNTGIAFYDAALGGWGIVGGTSVSAPIVASMWALSGDTGNALPGAERLYQSPQTFLAVGGGGTIAGLGIPNGLGAF